MRRTSSAASPPSTNPFFSDRDATDDSSETTTTRIQSFHRLNRNRPYKQAGVVLATCLCVLFYGHTLLSSTWPAYNAEQVVQYNAKHEKIFREQQLERKAKAEERRNKHRQAELEERRKERTLRNNKNQLDYDHEMANSTAADAQNTTTQDENRTDSHRKDDDDLLSQFISYMMSLGGFMVFMMIVRRAVSQSEISRTRSGRIILRRRQSGSHHRDLLQRQRRFRNWVEQLNRQRIQQGERPLSIQSLRLVLREGRNDGNDYDDLLNFSNEAGDAIQALTSTMGATAEEINRCPQRVLSGQDDLLRPSPTERTMPSCAVCLEPYQLGDRVRTIPCFHSFHSACVDPWLAEKAVCPICKHPAVA